MDLRRVQFLRDTPMQTEPSEKSNELAELCSNDLNLSESKFKPITTNRLPAPDEVILKKLFFWAFCIIVEKSPTSEKLPAPEIFELLRNSLFLFNKSVCGLGFASLEKSTVNIPRLCTSKEIFPRKAILEV